MQDGSNVENDDDESKEQRTRQQRHDRSSKGRRAATSDGLPPLKGERYLGYSEFGVPRRRRGYKIPTFSLRQQTTPVATVGSISSLLMPPYPLSVPKSKETTHENASFDSRVEPYPGLHRNGFCCGKASSHPGCLREGPHDVGCRY
jgi:hypothetical protein